MRKLFACIVIAALLLSLCACGTSYEFHGLDAYFHEGGVVGNSSTEIDYFFPADSFLASLPYTAGDYHYTMHEDTFLRNLYEVALLYYQYDAVTYEEVKTYCFDNILSTTPSETCGTYTFYDFYALRDKEDPYHCDNYPEAFKRVAFSDTDCAIVFLGICTTDQLAEALASDLADWDAFLTKHFGAFYTFDASANGS